MATMKMRVKGTYALLTHNPLQMAANNNTGPKKGVKEIPTPEAEAEMGLYHLEGGGYGLPGFAFRNSILNAAMQWKDNTRGSSRRSIIHKLSNLMVVEEMVPLVDDYGDLITSYQIDTRRAVVVGNGILRSRPKFPEWGARFTLEWDDELGVEANTIIAIASDAGRRVGVGDYRPQKIKGLPGPFGRYAVVSEDFDTKPAPRNGGRRR